jgi:hypothetical protein
LAQLLSVQWLSVVKMVAKQLLSVQWFTLACHMTTALSMEQMLRDS